MRELRVQIPEGLHTELCGVVEQDHRSADELVTEAISNYIEFRRWQRREIAEAMEEADRGEFAAPEEVDRIFQKFRG